MHDSIGSITAQSRRSLISHGCEHVHIHVTRPVLVILVAVTEIDPHPASARRRGICHQSYTITFDIDFRAEGQHAGIRRDDPMLQRSSGSGYVVPAKRRWMVAGRIQTQHPPVRTRTLWRFHGSYHDVGSVGDDPVYRRAKPGDSRGGSAGPGAHRSSSAGGG